MNLSAKSISINSSTKISLHPLASQLTKLIVKAYLSGGQEAYIKSMQTKFYKFTKVKFKIETYRFFSLGDDA